MHIGAVLVQYRKHSVYWNDSLSLFGRNENINNTYYIIVNFL